MNLILHILDKFFFVFHSVLILFNLFGWCWRKTRRLNLLILLLTAFSWFFLGLWYGFGYCPSTDWHWQVRFQLGYTQLPHSYTKFLVDTITGLDVPARQVDIAAVAGLCIAMTVSVWKNYKDWKKKKTKLD